MLKRGDAVGIVFRLFAAVDLPLRFPSKDQQLAKWAEAQALLALTAFFFWSMLVTAFFPPTLSVFQRPMIHGNRLLEDWHPQVYDTSC